MSTDSAAAAYPEPDVRPIVRTSPAGNRTLWIFGGLMLIAALLLFEALSARREALRAPATRGVPSSGALIAAPPPLALPPQFSRPAQVESPIGLPPALPPPRSFAPAPPPQVVTRIVERPAPVASSPASPPPSFAPQPVVIQAPAPPAALPSSQAAPTVVNERVLAGRLRNQLGKPVLEVEVDCLIRSSASSVSDGSLAE